MSAHLAICLSLLSVFLAPTRIVLAAQSDLAVTEPSVEPTADSPSLEQIRQVVRKAFTETHDGWSSDEVVLNTELNEAFLHACRQQLPATSPLTFNWTLLNMRKAGQLKIKTTKRNNASVAKFAQVAEIVARLVHDRHQVSSDRIMADPKLLR